MIGELIWINRQTGEASETPVKGWVAYVCVPAYAKALADDARQTQRRRR